MEEFQFSHLKNPTITSNEVNIQDKFRKLLGSFKDLPKISKKFKYFHINPIYFK